MQTHADKKGNRLPLLIAVGAGIFYLFYVCRQFMGDDWLWLANAKQLWSNFGLLLERPMYGYFRPLNLLWVAILQKLFGANAYLFSLINITLHSLNVYLLYRVLCRLTDNRRLILISLIVYAFYFLNAPAIEWISVGHDLWVTLLSLLCVLAVLRFGESPSPGGFLLILAAGLGALGFKESGFVTLGLYFATLWLTGRNPFGRRYLHYSLLLLIVYAAYLGFYFHNRVVEDTKDVALGLSMVTNTWYFVSYMLFPVARRMVELAPDRVTALLHLLKYVVTLLTPLLLAVAVWRGSRAVRLFLFWTVGFAATAAVFNWNLSLFDLYPPRTISRFMYTPNIGIAVLAGWLLSSLWGEKALRKFQRTLIPVVVTLLFVAVNAGIVYKMSQLYLSRQRLVGSVISDLRKLAPEIHNGETLQVTIPDFESTPSIIRTGVHLRAIVNVMLDRQVAVEIVDASQPNAAVAPEQNGILQLYWSNADKRITLGRNAIDRELAD